MQSSSHFLREMNPTEEQKEEALMIFAETVRIDSTMGQMSQAWHIPITSGQDPKWKLRQDIANGIKKIIDNSYKNELEEDS